MFIVMYLLALTCSPQIIRIRSQTESLDVSDESLQLLSEIGVKTTLR